MTDYSDLPTHEPMRRTSSHWWYETSLPHGKGRDNHRKRAASIHLRRSRKAKRR